LDLVQLPKHMSDQHKYGLDCKIKNKCYTAYMAVDINNELKTIIVTVNVPGTQGSAGPPGDPGPPGPPGPASELTIGTVAAGNTGDPAEVTLTGSTPSQVLNFVLPRGLTGAQGPEGVPGQDGTGIEIAGTRATYAGLPTDLTSADAGKGYFIQADGLLYIWDGSAFPASGSGIQFRGPAGPANTLTIGTVLTLSPGSTASATITGTAPNQTLDIGIPAGPAGAAGPGVATGGPPGSVLAKLTDTNFDTQWINATSAPTASTIMQRDAVGRAQVAEPSVSTDIATKNYVDTKTIPVTSKGVSLGVATLDATGKIPQTQLPSIAITDFLGVVSSQTALLALSGQRGDWATRSDIGADFILIADDPTKIANWRQLTSLGGVTSVAGRTGGIVLSHVDITDWDSAVGTTVAAATTDGIHIDYDATSGDLIIQNTYIETMATASPGSMRTVNKDPVTGFWPSGWSGDVPIYTGGAANVAVRPTPRRDIIIIWRGADPSPSSVVSGTGGMLRGIDERKIPVP
jgi:hypothetical protein